MVAALFPLLLGSLLFGGGAAAQTLESGRDAYEAGRFDEARAAFRARALSGDPSAQFMLGRLYELGEGVERDPDRAFQWYLTAALAGHGESQFAVGVIFDEGRGVPIDRAAAATWYARAALLGEERAARELGRLYASGDGVPMSSEIGRAWLAAVLDDTAEADDPPQRRTPSPRSGAALAAPMAPEALVTASPDGDGAFAAQLVWLPGDGAPAHSYFVEVVRLGDGPPTLVSAEYANVTGFLAPLPESVGEYAFRVFALSATREAYASSGWRRIGRRGGAALAAPEAEPLGLALYRVRLRVHSADAAATARAGDMRRDLALANIPVDIETLDAPPAASTVVYAFDQDRAAAEALALLLSLSASALVREEVGDGVRPGELVVTLQDGRAARETFRY